MNLSLKIVQSCNSMLSTNSNQFATALNPTAISSSLKPATSSWDPVNSVKSAQRLVSKAAKLRDKWMEFQGIKNWEGLLDPLDDNLRQEILRYGEFVEAAYRCFNFDTSSSDYAACRYPKNSMLTQCGLDRLKGYKVTKNLYATSGVQLPNWAHKIPSWVATQSSWIGYVAVCTDKNEISRLGRRDIVVAYRGTATVMEWLENLRTTLTSLPGEEMDNTSMVQTGFLSLYTTRHGGGRRSLQDSIKEEINKILQKYADEPISITVTGHSLGAAVAALTAHDITTTFKHAPLVTVVSFGGPRIGNKSFRLQLEKSGTKVLRIVNCDDPITKVPGFVLEEKNINLLPILSNWIQKKVEVYAEIGKELKLSSRDYPHLSNGNVATCHDLKTYLYLVDNFVSSNCRLRATAKRVLEKQKLKEQLLV